MKTTWMFLSVLSAVVLSVFIDEFELPRFPSCIWLCLCHFVVCEDDEEEENSLSFWFVLLELIVIIVLSLKIFDLIQGENERIPRLIIQKIYVYIYPMV